MKKDIIKKIKEKKDFWKKFKELWSKSNLNKINIKDFNFIKSNFDKNNLDIIKKYKNNISKKLRNKDKKIYLEDEKYNFKLV